jgi:HK97 family phage portal protein
VNPITRLAAGLKAFRMQWNAGARWNWWSGYGRSRYNFRAEIGDGRSNSIVQATVLWACRTFPEAPVRVSSINRDGELDPIRDHPLKQLLDTPNPYYAGELLWASTLSDWMISGNGYWLKLRSQGDRVVQLWWVPSTMIEPKWPDDGSAYLSHYEYTPNGEAIRLETRDVVHFRYLTLDPSNPRKGISPIASLAREIFTDDEAASYTAAMLRNVGVPPVVISPGKDARPTKEELEEVKSGFMEKTTGEHRGEPMVMRSETHVQVLGFNPQQMDLRNVRGIPEERVSALYGIPAAVVGLGSGLANSKVGATMSEFREQAYENMITPTQRLLAAELRTQLLPDFGDPARLRIDFDLSQVRVLQEDQNALYERLNATAWMTLDEKRSAVGLPPLERDAGNVLLIPNTVTPTDPADLLLPPEPEPAEPVALSPGQPAKVFALPAGKAFKEDATDALRTRLEQTGTSELVRFLNQQLGRVVARLRGGVKAAGIPDVDDLLPDAEEAALLEVLGIIHLRALVGAQLLAEEMLGVTLILDATLTWRFLTEVGKSVAGITNTTRLAVRDAIQAGLTNRETTAQIAERLRGLPEFSEARARLVARTEVASTVNRATLLAYEVSGVVVGVRVTDGDQDSGCAAVNGRTFPLADAPALLEHPNCVRRFSPITDARELAA